MQQAASHSSGAGSTGREHAVNKQTDATGITLDLRTGQVYTRTEDGGGASAALPAPRQHNLLAKRRRRCLKGRIPGLDSTAQRSTALRCTALQAGELGSGRWDDTRAPSGQPQAHKRPSDVIPWLARQPARQDPGSLGIGGVKPHNHAARSSAGLSCEPLQCLLKLCTVLR